MTFSVSSGSFISQEISEESLSFSAHRSGVQSSVCRFWMQHHTSAAKQSLRELQVRHVH